jgi:hypothetical protein
MPGSSTLPPPCKRVRSRSPTKDQGGDGLERQTAQRERAETV